MKEVRDHAGPRKTRICAHRFVARIRLANTLDRETGVEDEVQPLAHCAREAWRAEEGQSGLCVGRRSAEEPLLDTPVEITEIIPDFDCDFDPVHVAHDTPVRRV